MKRTLLFIVFSLLTCTGFAQERSKDIEAVQKAINSMFDGMRKGDSTLMRSVFAPKMLLQTIVSREGRAEVRTQSVDGFLKAVATPHDKVLDEQITFDAIHIDGDLASVWTSYKFFIGKDFSHCGVNSFQLVKLEGNWKINYIIDTRRKENCN